MTSREKQLHADIEGYTAASAARLKIILELEREIQADRLLIIQARHELNLLQQQEPAT